LDQQIHSNFIKSSNLIFGTAGLGLLNFFFTSDTLNSGKNIAIAIFTLLFIAVLGFLVRQGKNWVKYLLLILTVLGLFGIPVIIINIISEKLIAGVITIAQTIMQIWAVILLFKMPRATNNKIVDNKSVENS
jgi:hypothetical protein